MPYPSWVRAIYSARKYLSGQITHANNVTKEKETVSFLQQLGMKIESIIKRGSDTFHYLIHPSVFWTKAAYKAACEELNSLPENERQSTAVVASFPPLGPLIVGYKLATKYDLPLCLDYRDLWIGLGKTAPAHASPVRLLQLINVYCRKRIERKASIAVVISEGQREMHTEQSELKTAVIPNGFDFSKKKRNGTRKKKDTSLIIIRHLGLIYPPNRTPQPLLNALRGIHDASHKLHVEFYGTQPDLLLPMICESGCEAICSIYPQVPHTTSLELQQNADLLLLLDWSDENVKGVTAAKVFEYLASERPILLVGATEKSELKQLIQSSNAGYVFGTDPELIRKFLQDMIRRPQKYLHPRPISTIALQYDRKLLAEKYLQLIYRLIEEKNLERATQHYTAPFGAV